MAWDYPKILSSLSLGGLAQMAHLCGGDGMKERGKKTAHAQRTALDGMHDGSRSIEIDWLIRQWILPACTFNKEPGRS
ncbi:hypothetical protein GCM10027396_30280 [Insolitispirillum peregrinum]